MCDRKTTKRKRQKKLFEMNFRNARDKQNAKKVRPALRWSNGIKGGGEEGRAECQRGRDTSYKFRKTQIYFSVFMLCTEKRAARKNAH